MLRSLTTIIAILALPLAIAPATAAETGAEKTDSETSFTEVRQETRDLLSTLREYGVDQREEAVTEVKEALFELDNRILDLQVRIDQRWDSMSRTAREQSRESLLALQRQRVELAEWYGGLKSDSGAAWNDLKRGFSKAFDNINRGWENAVREFNAGTDADSAT